YRPLHDLSIKQKISEYYLGNLARHADRLIARWVVEQLTDIDLSDATQMLRELAGKPGFLGERAHRMLKVKERK
ncbi:hypothetical protein, partial [Candidatus Entotheonella palauensis]|uniref:hypothetical protein n=1 Tax=Candidatus Entotheonella palauensis TaxID=93172 RepID=UPI001C4DF4AF